MKRVGPVVQTMLLWCFLTSVSSGQEPPQYLGLQDIPVTSMSLNYGILAVGTDSQGVYWQLAYLPSDTGWKPIHLDSLSVRAVYPHKSGPIGWAISAGGAPDTDGTAFVYCSFVGGEFVPNSTGITDSLTEQVTRLDGYPDPTICGETYAAGGRALYRRLFTAPAWMPVYTTSVQGNIQTVKVKPEYPGIVLAGGSEGFAGHLLIKSTDFGDTWADISPPATVAAIDFAGDSADFIVAAAYQHVYRSTNGGKDWLSILTVGEDSSLTDVVYDIRTMSVYAAGGDGAEHPLIFISHDDGDHWQQFPLQLRGSIVGLEEDGTGWIYFATTHSGIFRIEQNVAGVHESNVAQPATAELQQNYPNPFNGSTLIRYTIPEGSFVSITVYNVLGQDVGSLVRSYHHPGTYVTRWSPTSISSGVYFYVLRTSASTRSRRMVVIR